MYQALVGHFTLFTCICCNQNSCQSVTTAVLRMFSCIIIKNLGNVWFQKISIPHHGGNLTYDPLTSLDFPYLQGTGDPPHSSGISIK